MPEEQKNPELEKHKVLIELIRQIAKEEAYAVLDEHLEDFEHKLKKQNNAEIGGQD